MTHRKDKRFEKCDFETREELEAGIGVGKTVLLFDVNRRIYTEGRGGNWAPLHRGHYYPADIVDETSRSWIVAGWDKKKIPKKKLIGVYSNLCADQAAWVSDNRGQLHRALERIFRGSHPNVQAVKMLVNLVGLDIPECPEEAL